MVDKMFVFHETYILPTSRNINEIVLKCDDEARKFYTNILIAEARKFYTK